jgi:hypothetical protein
MRTLRVVAGAVIGGSSFVVSGRYGVLVVGLGLILAFILLMVGMRNDKTAARLEAFLSLIFGRAWRQKPPDSSAPPTPAPKSRTPRWRRRRR